MEQEIRIEDVQASFETHHNRARIVLRKHLEAIYKVSAGLTLINRTLKSDEIEVAVKGLSEHVIDIAEIIDGTKNDMINLLMVHKREFERFKDMLDEIRLND